jgi:3',5'-cyclic-AMP phosphodiesterase
MLCHLMILIHLSDLHLSRYGESGGWKQRDDDAQKRWEVVHSWQRWQIEGLRDKKGRPDDLRLVDPEGVIHKTKNWPSRKDDKVISALLAMAMKRHQTSAERLISNRPTLEDLNAMLHVDPLNTNLRFLKVVDEILSVGPKVIVLTGDITDNGFGYGLVTHYFKEWVENRRLYVVPGNHDTYDMIPRLGRRARADAKEDRYHVFAAEVGMEHNEEGAYLRWLDDIVVVGLDSCKMPRTPLSASGAVSKKQLNWLREESKASTFRNARLRIGLVHHHLLRMPFAVGRRSPLEVGMRLRNAVDVMKACIQAGIDILFHGHRHHGYMVQLPGRPTVIAAPSSTLGCKSSDPERVYGWRMNLADEHPFPVAHDLLTPPKHA